MNKKSEGKQMKASIIETSTSKANKAQTKKPTVVLNKSNILITKTLPVRLSIPKIRYEILSR